MLLGQENERDRMAIVDDHLIVIEGLLKLLSKKSEFEICGTFTNGNDFVEFLKTNELDIVLLDTPNIARQLFLSKFTVENHRKNLLQKLNAKNVAELVSTASQHSLLLFFDKSISLF
jgi:DNA-binding NarL/FixJ family response regulator